MHLARRYRLKFAAQRGDRLALYLATAVAFHLGIMATGVIVWRSQTAQSEPQDPQPIEFVYLDSENAESPATGRTSNVNSQAGGNYDPTFIAAAGKPAPKPAELAESKPITPSTTGTYIPTYSQGNPDERKAIEPEVDDKPDSTDTPEQPPLTQPNTNGELPPLSPAPPPKFDDAAEPSSPIQVEQPADTTDLAEASTPDGLGLDGSFNPDHTALNTPGLDAQQDEILDEYVATVTQTIYQQWQRINPDRTRETIVRFEVNRLGQLIDLHVAQASGSDRADQIAIEAIEATAPFAPFPSDLPAPSIVINFRFAHNVRSRP